MHLFSRTALFSFVMLAVAACDPVIFCTSPATAEIRTVNQLIQETERNIERGYAIIRETRLERCPGQPPGGAVCPVESERPVAIDRTAERRNLATLLERRAELEAQERRELAQCRAQFG